MAEKKFTFEAIPETQTAQFKEHFPMFEDGLAKIGPGNFVFHPKFASYIDKVQNMQLRSDDVWIRTFPRSGKVFEYSV